MNHREAAVAARALDARNRRSGRANLRGKEVRGVHRRSPRAECAVKNSKRQAFHARSKLRPVRRRTRKQWNRSPASCLHQCWLAIELQHVEAGGRNGPRRGPQTGPAAGLATPPTPRCTRPASDSMAGSDRMKSPMAPGRMMSLRRTVNHPNVDRDLGTGRIAKSNSFQFRHMAQAATISTVDRNRLTFFRTIGNTPLLRLRASAADSARHRNLRQSRVFQSRRRVKDRPGAEHDPGWRAHRHA